VVFVSDISARDLSHKSLQLFLLYWALGTPVLKVLGEFSFGMFTSQL
jgi:hypothetical protein